jgi:hypothetical protein
VSKAAPVRFLRIPLEVAMRADLSDRAKVLYGALAMHDSREKGCFPGQRLLAEETGKSVPAIKRALEELVNAGLVWRKREGRFGRNRYRLVGSEVIPHPGDDGSEVIPLDGSEVIPLGDQKRSHSGLTSDPTEKTSEKNRPLPASAGCVQGAPAGREDDDVASEAKLYREWIAGAGAEWANVGPKSPPSRLAAKHAAFDAWKATRREDAAA